MTRQYRREQAMLRYTEEEALQVQRSLLGAALKQYGDFTFAATTRAAKGVGGDYYDSFETADGEFAFCIADCMGKGTAAALIMANLQAQLRSASGKDVTTAEVCSQLNERASREEYGRLTTMFYGVVDTRSRKLRFTNAGHFPAILARADGSVVRLNTEDALLGAIPSWEYREDSIELHPGDRMLLVTDGLLEATGATGEELGEETLIEWAVKSRALRTPEFLDSIFAAALEHCSHKLHDDATAVVIGLN
jgi:serine phosphatase RsbU (regulator of sigma subunit)